MSAPSRRPEIRRRRTRAEKIAKLRKRLAAASASTDKDRLTAKLHRAGFTSPGNPLIKSA
jgi:crotonobetainyl-CoA:carnitine CoA-transferase CaiB-like acyl-CoA transferase